MGFRNALLTVVLLSAVTRGQQQPSFETPILPGQAEDFSFLSGRWIRESGPDLADGRYAGSLAIYAQPTQITVTRERIPQEVYRVLDLTRKAVLAP